MSTNAAENDRPWIIAAFAMIYVVWGSTYLAIRVLVATVPPLLSAGVRFFTAGLLLYGFARMRGAAAPTRKQWKNVGLVSLSMFVVTYGALFWAEKFVPSGMASVLAATVPLATVVLEVWVFRTLPFRAKLMAAALVGLAGVTILTWQGGQQHAPLLPSLAILAGAIAWAFGSVLSHSVQLPESRVVTSGAEMLTGGAGLLVWSLAAGEWRGPIQVTPGAAWAMVYLITVGSLVGFTAFVYLLSKMPASRISSYAYVNPVVAVILGHFVAGEELSWRTAAGALLIVGSVVATLKGRGEKRYAAFVSGKPDPLTSRN